MDRYTLRKLIKVHAWWHWVRVSEQVCKRQFICVHNSVALAFPFVVSHGSGGSTIFSKGACKYESSGQTSGQRNGRGGIGGGGGGGGLRFGLCGNIYIFSFGFQRNLRYYSYLVVYLDDCMAITARSENRFSARVFRHC